MRIRDVSSKIIEIMQQLKNDQDSDPTVANGHCLASLGAALKCHQDDLKNRNDAADKAEAAAADAAKAAAKLQEERKANLEAKVHDLRKLRKDHPKHFTVSHKQDLEDAKNSLAGLLAEMKLDVPADLTKHEDFDADQAAQKAAEEKAAKKAAPAPTGKK